MYIHFFLLFSVLSRTITVPFVLPSVIPETEEQYAAFEELVSLLSSGTLSSALGWAVAQGKCLEDNLSLQKEIKCSLRGSSFHAGSFDSSIFFLKQVSYSHTHSCCVN